MIREGRREGKPELLTSAANPLLRDVRRAVARGCLTPSGYWVAEGFHLLDEALRSPVEIGAVLISETARGAVESRGLRGARTILVPAALFERLASTETTQGVISLVKPRSWTLDDLLRRPVLLSVLDGLQDPGNAGAVVRSSEAFGATGVVFLSGTAGPHNPKTLRASAGSLFRLPFVEGWTANTISERLSRSGLAVYAAVPYSQAGSAPVAEADFSRDCALVFGSEAHGISPELAAAARPVSIPTAGVESLNAAVAAGIILYEARRQRSASG